VRNAYLNVLFTECLLSYRFDVKDILHFSSSNHLALAFTSPVSYAKKEFDQHKRGTGGYLVPPTSLPEYMKARNHANFIRYLRIEHWSMLLLLVSTKFQESPKLLRLGRLASLSFRWNTQADLSASIRSGVNSIRHFCHPKHAGQMAIHRERDSRQPGSVQGEGKEA